MKLKNIFASVAAAAITLGSAVFPVSAAEDMSAYIYIADTEWACQYWGEGDPANTIEGLTQDVIVTGDGQYTVSLDVSDGYRGNETDFTTIADFNVCGVAIENCYGEYPDLTISFDSVKIDGEKVILKDGSESYLDDDDVSVKIDLYNNYGYKALSDAASYKDFSKIEITFTVSGMGVDKGSTTTKEDDVTTTSVTAAETTTTTAASTTSEKTTTTTTVTTSAEKVSAPPATSHSGIAYIVCLGCTAAAISVMTMKKK